MKLKKQAIFPVLMMLVVSALALISSSFAWFSISNIARVSEISASAQSSGVEFLISNDGDNYYASNLRLPNSTNNKSYINPEILYQVSTSGAIDATTGLVKFYNSDFVRRNLSGSLYVNSLQDKSVSYSNDGKIAPATVTSGSFGANGLTSGLAYDAVSATYIVFDLYVSLDRAANIYLYNGSAVTSGDNTNLKNSIRVGFEYLGSTTTNSNQSTIIQLLDTSKAKFTIWEPNPTTSVSTYGVNSDSYKVVSNVKSFQTIVSELNEASTPLYVKFAGNLTAVGSTDTYSTSKNYYTRNGAGTAEDPYTYSAYTFTNLFEELLLDDLYVRTGDGDESPYVYTKQTSSDTYSSNSTYVVLDEFVAYGESIYTATQTTKTGDAIIVGSDLDVTGVTALNGSSALAAGYHKFRVYIWLEGNDPDCTSAVQSKELAVNLAFYAEDKS
ncbi:MAG: hypothetical protein K6G38_02905 [Gammaproteobacteria bacterium]|nr:hypothetical protein [Gammaproteobacteria bacterium]